MIQAAIESGAWDIFSRAGTERHVSAIDALADALVRADGLDWARLGGEGRERYRRIVRIVLSAAGSGVTPVEETPLPVPGLL